MIEALITGGMIATAVFFVARSVYRLTAGKASGCGHCGESGCAKTPEPKS